MTHTSGGTEETPRIQFTVKYEKSPASLFSRTLPSHLPRGIQHAFQSNQAQTTDLALSPIIRKQPGKQHITKSFQVLFSKPARAFYPEQAICYVCLRLKIFSSPLVRGTYLNFPKCLSSFHKLKADLHFQRNTFQENQHHGKCSLHFPPAFVHVRALRELGSLIPLQLKLSSIVSQFI